jgi:ribonuclease HII
LSREAISSKKQKSVTFQTSESGCNLNNEESTCNGALNETTMEMFQRLTNKKREYLEEAIEDKNGRFCYEEDPNEYKKARKRMQNRESAVRSRLRKKYHQDELEIKIMELEKIQKEITEQNAGLAA